MQYKIKHILRNPILFIKDIGPFLLAHHPSCKYFDDHAIVVKGRRLCIGCTFLLPSFFILLLMFFYSNVLLIISFRERLIFAFILMGLQLTSVLHLGRKNKVLKAVVKVVTGIGIAIFTYTILTMNVSLSLKLVILVFFYYLTVGLWGLYTIRHFSKTCQNCEFKGNWLICNGFGEIHQKLIKHGFIELDKYKLEIG